MDNNKDNLNNLGVTHLKKKVFFVEGAGLRIV